MLRVSRTEEAAWRVIPISMRLLPALISKESLFYPRCDLCLQRVRHGIEFRIAQAAEGVMIEIPWLLWSVIRRWFSLLWFRMPQHLQQRWPIFLNGRVVDGNSDRSKSIHDPLVLGLAAMLLPPLLPSRQVLRPAAPLSIRGKIGDYFQRRNLVSTFTACGVILFGDPLHDPLCPFFSTVGTDGTKVIVPP